MRPRRCSTGGNRDKNNVESCCFLMNTKKLLVEMRKNAPLYFAFLFITIAQVAVILYYTCERRNLYIDEIWTFNTANHYFFPFLFQNNEPYLNTWLPASFWAKSIVADPAHTFSYGSVFYNMSLDHHPPLYIAVIHTVCSLFPGEFSRWFGIVPNLLFFILGQVTFYVINCKLFGKKAVALGLCLLFGSCWGTVNNVILIRMYTLLVLFALLFFYAHLQMLINVKKQDYSKKTLLLLYVFSICGFLTHYYFLIYASYMFFSTVVLLCFYHKKHVIAPYFFTLLGALLSCILINPCILDQIFGITGQLGTESWHNLIHSDFMSRSAIMSGLISRDLLGHKARLFILLVTVIFVIKAVLKILEKHEQEPADTAAAAGEVNRAFSLPVTVKSIQPGIFLAAVSSSAYFITVAKIVPYYQNRYMYIIYPLIIICLFSILYGLLQSLTLKRGLSLALTVLIIMGLNTSYYSPRNLDLLDDSYPKMLAAVKSEYSNVNMITVSNTSCWWPVVSNILVYREVPYTLMIDESRLPEIDRITNALPFNPDAFLIYRGICCKTKPKDFITMVKMTTGFTNHKQFGRQQFGEIYLFSRK